MGDLQAKLDALKAELETLQIKLNERGEEASGAGADHLNDALKDALQAVHDIGDQLEDWSGDHLETVRRSVREQPLASCVLAMGAGALLRSILFRR